MTIALYVRVSTLEQAKEGYSISSQREKLEMYCESQGWTDYKLYADEGVSAKDTNRPQLQKMFKDIKQGNISMILVYRLDRFTRSVSDLYELLKEMEKHNCSFKSATEPYDTSTAMGRVLITIIAALAQWERENSSERIKLNLEKKVAGGERVGNIPYGFDLSEEEKLVKNPNTYPVVLDMIKKIKSGSSANQIAVYLSKVNSDRKWTARSVLRILRNPALYGATRWNDKVFEDTHEGLISKTEFIKLQQMLDDRSIHHRREVENAYLFQGVLACPNCDRPLSVNRYIRTRKDGTEYQGAIYRCQLCEKQGTKVYKVGESKMLKAFEEYMKNIEFDKIEVPEPEEDDRFIYLEQLRQVEKKREKYQKAWGADLISDGEFEKLMGETRETYEELKKKINSYKEPTKINVEEIKDIVIAFNQGFKYLTSEEKRTFISTYIKKIHYDIIPQQPLRPDKAKRGKPLIIVTDVKFY